ncbi:RNA-directed DNA polymerase (Reverse transcriptase), Ribonuclease H [Gossypium australe]|uniref:RNA-directed DNA polymerase (Reverse transcriptase), Ribonuclease H n=1 Tax=Gossypium australe TaxID=47621 RepID=A0A5B6WWZ1_9ROSI|nr:RNA-directed DNA polymerase (Reverse transcriptase), Ribonuclease H [Gossypium australe]
MLYHTTWLISKMDPLKYMMESTALNGRMKAEKGSAIVDSLTGRAIENYEPLNFDFLNEDLMYVATTEKDGDHYPFTSKLDFDCTNNIVEYEACIIGIRAAIERKIKETRDPKLIEYRRMVLKLIKEFDDITFCYLQRHENQMADALATLASMVKVNKQEDVKPIQMSIYEALAHCYNIEEEERDDYPWYHKILHYVKNREYPK